MLDLRGLAERKALDCGGDAVGWQNALMRSYRVFSEQPMSDQEFTQLVDACRKPGQVVLLAREYFRFKKSDPAQGSAHRFFLKEVDDSEFEMSQWIEAIEFLFSWLEQRKKAADFKTICGYLNCCAQAPDNKLHQRYFVDVLKDFLDRYGFERARDLK